MKGLPLQPGSFGQRVGIELGGQASLEVGFEDVAARAVWQKASLIEVHLLVWSLEVQCN